MRTTSLFTSLAGRVAVILATACGLAVGTTGSLQAADITWDDGSGNFLWDLTSPNWSGMPWNNANGDGALFGPTGAGAIDVTTAINVNSLNFMTDGYSLNGSGSLNFVSGSSTLGTGVVNVASGATAAINVGVNSAVGFEKLGAGTLVLSAPSAITGNISLTTKDPLKVDMLIGATTGTTAGGTVRLASANVLDPSIRMGIGSGYLDIGSNNVTLGSLTFTNQNPSAPWNATLMANNGVIGSGTLHVAGDIGVIGQNSDAFGNSIAANVDLGGGTQVVRIGAQSFFAGNTALMFTGSLSNGSLLKTVGYSVNGAIGATDGISLFGNNTYTGSTVLNGGQNVATGSNASTSVKIIGALGSIYPTTLTLLGANGSYQSATTIQAFAGGTFVLDNNASLGTSGNNQPNIAAAQNNDRIRDDAQVQLRDGGFTYRGFAGAAATETYGSLNALDGYNNLTLTANGGGSATLTATGDLTLGSRATLQVISTTLGGATKAFFNGATPTADATGILPRVVSGTDFVTYNSSTGLTPFTNYATDFSTPGTNVARTAASSTSDVTINALKTTGTFTTTINSGSTLGISSGMILSTSGTSTLAGGTVAFGSAPGTIFGGVNISSAITGTQGMIMATGSQTLSGDLSGLSGSLTVENATTTVSTDTFAGPIQIRAGQLNLNVSQSSTGAITLGVPGSESNVYGNIPILSFSGAPVNTTFSRPIIVDNGATSLAGVALPFSLLPTINPKSNASGSQTISGDVTLNTSVNLQGGGGGGTGATNFTGAITGPGTFYIPNGRVNFTGAISNGGGFVLGNSGNKMFVAFSGTVSGTAPITVNGGSSNGTTVSYQPGSLPTGPITVQNAVSTQAPAFIPLADSTINNTFNLNGDTIANVGAGITATWNGAINGASALTKTGAGTLVLGNATNTHTGSLTVSAGSLAVNGVMPSSTVTVASTGTLGGTGNVSGVVTVSSGGTLAPGNGIGAFTTGGLTLAGTFQAEIDLNNGGAASADLLNVNGTVSLTGGTLMLALSNLPTSSFSGTYLLLANDGSDAVSGTFSSIIGLPANYTATIDYGFNGTDSLGRIGTGNDVAVTIAAVPEPVNVILLLVGGLILFAFCGRRKPIAS